MLFCLYGSQWDWHGGKWDMDSASWKWEISLLWGYYGLRHSGCLSHGSIFLPAIYLAPALCPSPSLALPIHEPTKPSKPPIQPQRTEQGNWHWANWEMFKHSGEKEKSNKMTRGKILDLDKIFCYYRHFDTSKHRKKNRMKYKTHSLTDAHSAKISLL